MKHPLQRFYGKNGRDLLDVGDAVFAANDDVLPCGQTTTNDLAVRDLVPVLTRQAGLLRDDGDLLDELAATIDPRDARALSAAPVPLARRAVRRWLTTEHPPDAATVERVLRVASGHASGCDIGSGRRVERSRQRLHLLGEPSVTPSR